MEKYWKQYVSISCKTCFKQFSFWQHTLSKLHFSSASSGQRNSCRPTCQSIYYCSRFMSSGLLCYANQSILTFIFRVKQSKKKVTTKATVLSPILTTWTGKMALFGKGHWNLWFNRWACRKSLLMVLTSGTLQVTFHCAVWGVFWNTTSSEMWRCKIRQVCYYMHKFITNKMKKELFCLF